MQDWQIQNWQVIAIVAAAVVIVAALAWVIYSRSRSQRLRQRFGPEYDRMVIETGDRRRAEAALAQREARVRKLRIQPLSVADRHRFMGRWKQCQALFVDDPVNAVQDADLLIDEIMRTRGYTADSREERLGDISAAYPDHAAEYREAHEIVGRHRRGEASTEDLRKAFLEYRDFFDELLEDTDHGRRAA
jgi:hypothetical protein